MQNVKEYGAVGDGVVSDTKAIQRAIDAGGEVLFPPGIYKTGTLFLRSHGGLRLERGAVILSGGDEEEWNAVDFCPVNHASAGEKTNGRHLIVAYRCEDVFIQGGRIDGCFSHWLDEFNPHNPLFKLKLRNSQMLYFCECQDVRIQDCELCNASYWHCFLYGCERIHLSGMTIRGDHRVPCDDGIDLDCCRQATVSDCLIDTGDDALTVRACSKRLGPGEHPSEQIVVSNCVLSSCFGDGLRLGVGEGVIRDCLFSNLVVHHSNIGVELASSYSGEDGVTMENLSFDHLRLNTYRPFKILLEAENCHRAVYAHFRNIDFSRIRGRAEASSEIFGNKTGEISGLRFSDLQFDYYGKGPCSNVDELGYWCKESTASAFQIRDVAQASFDRLQVNWCANQDLWLHEVEAEHSKVEFSNCQFQKGCLLR